MKSACQRLILLSLFSFKLVRLSDFPSYDDDDGHHFKRMKTTETGYIAVTSSDQQVQEQTNVAAENIYDFDQTEENQPLIEDDLYSGKEHESEQVMEKEIHQVNTDSSRHQLGMNVVSVQSFDVARYTKTFHVNEYFTKKKARVYLPQSDSEGSTSSKMSKASSTSLNSTKSMTSMCAPKKSQVDIESGGSTPLLSGFKEEEDEEDDDDEEEEDIDQVHQKFGGYLFIKDSHERDYDGESEFESDDQSHN